MTEQSKAFEEMADEYGLSTLINRPGEGYFHEDTATAFAFWQSAKQDTLAVLGSEEIMEAMARNIANADGKVMPDEFNGNTYRYLAQAAISAIIEKVRGR